MKEEDIKIHVVIFMFDMLLLNGESLLQKPLAERRALLRSTIKEVEGRMMFATSMEVVSGSFIKSSWRIQSRCRSS